MTGLWRITVDVRYADTTAETRDRLFAAVAGSVSGWQEAHGHVAAGVMTAPADECCPEVRRRLAEMDEQAQQDWDKWEVPR